MKILVIGDEERAVYHPLGRLVEGIYRGLETAAGMTFQTEYRKLTKEDLSAYDVVISYIDSYQTLGSYVDVLAGYIEEGGHFLALHNGIISEDGSSLEKALGGNFIDHPPYCELTYYRYGEKLCTMGEEAYMVRQTDDKNEIFLEFEYEGVRYPAGWYRRSGKGVAAYLAPGHDEKTGERESFQTLLRETVQMLAAL